FPAAFGAMRTSVSSFISAWNEQPTPQYAQVVVALRVGWPSAITLFSSSAPVGHDCTQAPHETHSDPTNGSSWLAAIREASPRPSTVRAKVPWTSEHARTQREQTMHRLGSNAK